MTDGRLSVHLASELNDAGGLWVGVRREVDLAARSPPDIYPAFSRTRRSIWATPAPRCGTQKPHWRAARQ
jgi:hypothetical protein